MVNLNHQERPFTISALIYFPLRASQRERLKQRLEHEPASLAIALAPSAAIQAQGDDEIGGQQQRLDAAAQAVTGCRSSGAEAT
jgi:hypothetical protein